MNPREERGLIIAATCRLTKRESGEWSVPSQSGNGRYIVTPNAGEPCCTCPDYETRGGKCKHIFAVEYAIRREQNADGDTVITQTVTVTETVKKPTYPQVWPAYNEAQTHEKDHFLQLLHDLCRGIHETPVENNKGGRPRIPAADAVFAACFKVYSTFRGRRFMSDLRHAHELGYIDKTPHFNSIFNALENAELTPVLHAMIRETSLSLKTVESDFAADASGFSTSRFVRWFDVKYGVVRQKHDWVKVHLMCGVKTNIVTAVEILDRDAADTKQMPALVWNAPQKVIQVL
ncbi:MAG: SWIM zinc finger family protein [Gemmataceae bacterium]